MQPSRILLRRVGQSLRVSIPKRFVEQHGLNAEDYAVWREEPDGSVRLKFYRFDELEQLKEAEASPQAA